MTLNICFASIICTSISQYFQEVWYDSYYVWEHCDHHLWDAII